MVALPANLPNISKAKLPATYEEASRALTACARIDECKSWADKAAAMASYAKQADDMELHNLADRIKARAIQRCGELLREVEAAVNQHAAKSAGRGTPTGRMQAARDAGLSKDQAVTALRVANVPKEEFDRLVESDTPPTVTKLAEMGKQSKPRNIVDLGGRDPREYAMSTQAQGRLNSFADDCADFDPAAVVRGALPHERKRLLESITTLGKWLVLLREELEA